MFWGILLCFCFVFPHFKTFWHKPLECAVLLLFFFHSIGRFRKPTPFPFHSFRFHCVALPFAQTVPTHSRNPALRHDSEGTIQSSGPIQWTNQPTTNQPPPPPRLGGNIRYHANTYASSHNIDIDINSNTLRHDSEGAGCDPRGTVSPDSFIHSNILSCWDDGSLLSFCVRTHTYAHQ
mmetsp:Transcript_12927/g.36429  ORF Transcript_12927/g.36429 Transcript_12927/m.36429 type:complete len:178 (+) Transcript_12927:289-822(+)